MSGFLALTMVVSIAAILLGVVGTAMAGSTTVTATAGEVTTFQNPDGTEILEGDREGIEGSVSTLARANDTISMTIETSSLPAGVYTIWWHLATGQPEESILWATFRIVGDDGEANFSAVLEEGENPGFVFTGDGLEDAQGADVEAFVRYHGPARFTEPEILNLQLTHPFGGCTDSRNPMPTLDDFDCFNPQIAVHETLNLQDDDDDDDDDDD